MNRTLITCAAVLCAASAAQAQSNVTLYGSADISVNRVNNGTGGVTKVESGAGVGSRLGFRGTEDLGGGLAANFLLEQGIAVDSGVLNQNGAAFGRQSWVGLSSRAGWSVSAGRQYSPVLIAVSQTDPSGQNYWGSSQGTGMGVHEAPNAGIGTGGHQAILRVNNSVLAAYRTGPFAVNAMFSAGDENARRTGRLGSIGGSYSSGPVLVTGSIARFRQFEQALAPGASPAMQTTTTLGGAYDFGFVKLFVGTYSYEADGIANRPAGNPNGFDPRYQKNRSYWIGARVPVGSDTLIANVMRSRYDYGSAPEGVGQTLQLVYEHPLSKRTMLYANWARVNNNAAGLVPLMGGVTFLFPAFRGADLSAAAVGVRHSF